MRGFKQAAWLQAIQAPEPLHLEMNERPLVRSHSAGLNGRLWVWPASSISAQILPRRPLAGATGQKSFAIYFTELRRFVLESRSCVLPSGVAWI
jgi:hypothetical protein